jgi:hypothetical protein
VIDGTAARRRSVTHRAIPATMTRRDATSPLALALACAAFFFGHAAAVKLTSVPATGAPCAPVSPLSPAYATCNSTYIIKNYYSAMKAGVLNVTELGLETNGAAFQRPASDERPGPGDGAPRISPPRCGAAAAACWGPRPLFRDEEWRADCDVIIASRAAALFP